MFPLRAPGSGEDVAMAGVFVVSVVGVWRMVVVWVGVVACGLGVVLAHPVKVMIGISINGSNLVSRRIPPAGDEAGCCERTRVSDQSATLGPGAAGTAAGCWQ